MLYLHFKIDGESYGLPSADIVEVIPLLPLRKQPGVPKYVAGLLNYRGQLIPVIDLARLFTQGASAQRASTRIVVVKYRVIGEKRLLLGLIAERATETLALDDEGFSSPLIANPGAPYLGGVNLSTLNQQIHPIQRVDVQAFLPGEVQALLYPEEAIDGHE